MNIKYKFKKKENGKYAVIKREQMSAREKQDNNVAQIIKERIAKENAK